jgi:hypothetical protein
VRGRLDELRRRALSTRSGEYGAISVIIPSAKCGMKLVLRYPDLLLSQNGFTRREGYWMSSRVSNRSRDDRDHAPRRTRSAHRRPRGALRPTGRAEGCGPAARSARLAHDDELADFLRKVQEIVEQAEVLLEQRVAE